MKKILPIIEVWLLFLIVISLTSCGTQRKIKNCEKCFNTYSDTNVVIKDSISILFDTIVHKLEVPADTSIQIIQIVCDSTGNASIKTSTTTNGNRSRINTSLINNELTIQATCKSYIDSIQVLNKTIDRQRSKVNTVFVPKLVEKKLSWWQKFKINYGGYAFALIGAYLGFTAVSLWAKSKNPLIWLKRLKGK